MAFKQHKYDNNSQNNNHYLNMYPSCKINQRNKMSPKKHNVPKAA